MNIFIFLFLFVVKGTEIISTFPHVIQNGGSVYTKTSFTIRCDSTVPMSFNIFREGAITPDTVTVECSPPEIRYNSQLRSYVPLGQNLVRMPIGLSTDLARNITTEKNAYVNRLVNEAMNNARFIPRSSNNLLALSRKLLQSDSDDPNPPPPAPLPAYDPKVAPPLIPFSDPVQPNKFAPLDTPNSDSITSVAKIETIEIAEDVGVGLILSLTTGPLAILSESANVLVSLAGDDPLELVVKDIKILFTDVANIVKQLGKMFDEQIRVDQVYSAQFTNIYATEDAILARQTQDEIQIFALRNRTDQLLTYINGVKQSMDNRFSKTDEDIKILESGENNITRAVELLIQHVDDRFTQLLHTINILQQEIITNSDAAEGIRQNRQVIRIAALMFHDSLNTMLSFNQIGPGLPFMNDIGAAPLSADDRAKRRSVAGSVIMASVEIQGTAVNGLTYTAVQFQIQIICDPTYIANFTLTSVGFDFILQAIGPHTDQQVSCTDPWFCNCAFKVVHTTIALANLNQVYPFDPIFSAGLPLLEDLSVQSLITPDDCVPVRDAGCALSENYFFDQIDDFYTFLSGALVCSPYWYGNLVRVANARIGYHVRISTNPADYAGGAAEMCNTDYTFSTSNTTTIGFTAFTYLRKEFDLYWGVIRTSIDRILYGSLGQVAIKDMIGSRLPGLVNAYRTIILEYVSLLSRREETTVRILPMYIMTKEETVFRVKLTVNNQPAILLELSGQEQTMPINDSHTGNLSLASNSQLSSIRGIEQLGETMLWLGPELVYDGDARMKDDQGPIVLIDFAENELCDGLADQRANCMNYLELRRASLPEGYPFGEGMPFNLSSWSISEGHAVFKPEYANSPSGRLIKINRDSLTCLYEQLDPVTMTYKPSGPFRTMCNIRKDFNVPLSFGTDSDISFKARDEWTYDFEFDWTGTKVEELSITRCPDSAEVVDNGTAILLRSSSPITVRISICTDFQVNCITMGTDTAVSGSLRIPFNTLNIKYYFQAWPSSDPLPTLSNRCYSQSGGLGIPVFIDRNYTYVTGLPNNVEAAVAQMLTTTQIQMQNMFIIMMQFQQAAIAIATDPQSANLDNILNQIINATTDQIANVGPLGDDPALDALQVEVEQEFNITAGIMDKAAAAAQAAADAAILDIFNGRRLNNISDAIINQLLNDSRVLDGLIDKLVNDINDLGSPFRLSIEDLINGIVNAAVGLAKGLIGGLFGLLGLGGNVLEWIKDIILIVIVCCLIAGCCIFIKKIRPLLKEVNSGHYNRVPKENE